MTAHKLGEWSADDPAWHNARAGRIGGSDVGVILGWSPFVTRDELLRRKAGLLPPQRLSKAMARGNYLEPAVAAWLADEAKVTYDDTYRGTWVDDRDDWMLYNPDAVTTDGRLCEFKTTATRSAEHGWGRAGTADVPLTYAAQVQWGMGILGMTDCLFAVLSGAPKFEFARYRVRFDRAIFTYLREQVTIFRADLDALTQERSAA